jgi:hypothetical protein
MQALPPQWLDAVIDSVILKNDANAIARAVAHSDRFMAAIQQGIQNAKSAPPGMPGPTHAQFIREAIQEAVAATT